MVKDLFQRETCAAPRQTKHMAKEWFARDFDHPLYFEIYQDKERDAEMEGRALVALLGLRAGNLVLDLPCGWGRLRPALDRAGLHVIGGDLSQLNLKRHQHEHPGHLVRMDLRALPFQTKLADGVFCAFTSWGYFRDEASNLRQLEEFRRVLKPGGVLLLDLVGRRHLEAMVGSSEMQWRKTSEGYEERVRWSADRRRILTDRRMNGVRFQHDIWIPEDFETRAMLKAAGFDHIEAFGGLEGRDWHASAERWIYRCS